MVVPLQLTGTRFGNRYQNCVVSYGLQYCPSMDAGPGKCGVTSSTVASSHGEEKTTGSPGPQSTASARCTYKSTESVYETYFDTMESIRVEDCLILFDNMQRGRGRGKLTANTLTYQITLLSAPA